MPSGFCPQSNGERSPQALNLYSTSWPDELFSIHTELGTPWRGPDPDCWMHVPTTCFEWAVARSATSLAPPPSIPIVMTPMSGSRIQSRAGIARSSRLEATGAFAAPSAPQGAGGPTSAKRSECVSGTASYHPSANVPRCFGAPIRRSWPDCLHRNGALERIKQRLFFQRLQFRWRPLSSERVQARRIRQSAPSA